jgi:hypothetical protein
MAVDGKYGRVTLEHGAHIPDDEPVVVFRAQDVHVPALLDYYAQLCTGKAEASSGHDPSPPRHIRLILQAQKEIEAWQASHHARVPTSETSRAWLED